MRRGEIWTAAGGKDYGGKPRPIVILQDDLFPETDSLTVCPLTRDQTASRLFRIEVRPSSDNGLRESSCLMADKITTVSKAKLGKRTGVLSDADMTKLDRAVMIFLGLAG